MPPKSQPCFVLITPTQQKFGDNWISKQQKKLDNVQENLHQEVFAFSILPGGVFSPQAQVFGSAQFDRLNGEAEILYKRLSN